MCGAWLFVRLAVASEGVRCLRCIGIQLRIVLDNGHITMVEPKAADDQDWAQPVEFLAGRFASWTFIETESGI